MKLGDYITEFIGGYHNLRILSQSSHDQLISFGYWLLCSPRHVVSSQTRRLGCKFQSWERHQRMTWSPTSGIQFTVFIHLRIKAVHKCFIEQPFIVEHREFWGLPTPSKPHKYIHHIYKFDQNSSHVSNQESIKWPPKIITSGDYFRLSHHQVSRPHIQSHDSPWIPSDKMDFNSWLDGGIGQNLWNYHMTGG